jgi:hypothetical protein
MRIVGAGRASVAFGAGNQCSRIFEPSKAVIVQSLALPGTRVATTGPPVFGGTHLGAVAVVARFAVDGGVADFDDDGDDEHAAITATARLVPIRLSLPRTLVPPDVCG